MISWEDCMAMCGLERNEIAAIAEHEHVPEVAATALAQYLLRKKDGSAEIRQMMIDDIRKALAEKRVRHAAELVMALRHFLDSHPEAGEAP
jgi:hypothetical protein